MCDSSMKNSFETGPCRNAQILVFAVLLFVTNSFTCCISQENPTSSATWDSSAKPAPKIFTEPMVARVELRLTIGEKEVDVIEKGDLLTVLEEREKSFLIRTFRGVKGGIEKANLVTLAESVETYDEVIKGNPKVGRFYTLRAGAHWARGNTEKALADFDEAIRLGYVSANAYSSRALFLTATHAYEKAIEDFSKAIEKGDKSESIYVNRAAAYLQMNMVDEAIADYSAAIQLNDKNAGVIQQRATAHKVKGELDKAVVDFTKAMELSPNFIPAIMGRGYVYFQQGDHAKAIVDFSKVIELNGRAAVAFNNRGYNYQQIGKYKEALEDFKKAIELTPDYALAHQNLGWLLSTCKDESMRDAKTAIASATKACELNEYNDLSDLAALAASHASAKEFSLAIGLQEKIVERAAAPQKPLAEKLLELYRNEKPFDPDLKIESAAEIPTSEKTSDTNK
jgi:tetratricopeptide (TPR) repeat protein